MINKTLRVATIDVGSNTILLQIVEKNEQNDIEIIAEFQRFARLGDGLKRAKKIIDDSIVKAQKIMAEYSKFCQEFDVDIIVAVATSAIREAVNSQQVTNRLESAFNSNNSKNQTLKIQVISGDEEAELCFKGTASGNELNTIIDIGGGSTEIITGQNGRIIDKISIPIGVVKLTEELDINQPVSDYKVLRIRQHLKKVLADINKIKHNGRIIAVSGTPTTLAAIHLDLREYSVTKINNFRFNKELLQLTVAKILNLELEKLINKYRISQYRADVLSAGALLLDEILLHLNQSEFTVSTNGLRYGLALQTLENIEDNEDKDTNDILEMIL